MPEYGFLRHLIPELPESDLGQCASGGLGNSFLLGLFGIGDSESSSGQPPNAPYLGEAQNEIDVVAQDHHKSWADYYLNEGDPVYAPSSNVDMIEQVIERGGGEPIDEVRIKGHGEPGAQMASENGLLLHKMLCTPRHPEAVCDKESSETLQRLGENMDEGGSVLLEGCRTGKGSDGEELVRRVSENTKRETRAADWYQTPFLSGLEGPETVCRPNDEGKVECGTQSWGEWLWGTDPSSME